MYVTYGSALAFLCEFCYNKHKIRENGGQIMTALTPGIYRHYKGGMYQVIAVATHSETLEPMVVYQSMKDGGYWVRPLSMWNDIIEKDGRTMTRFTRIS